MFMICFKQTHTYEDKGKTSKTQKKDKSNLFFLKNIKKQIRFSKNIKIINKNLLSQNTKSTPKNNKFYNFGK